MISSSSEYLPKVQSPNTITLEVKASTHEFSGRHNSIYFAVHLLSYVWLFVTPWTAVLQASLSFTISWSILKLTSIESVMPYNHLILCHPLLLLPSIFPSIRVFFNESVLHIRWPKYWSFSFSIRPSNEYSGLISFRIGWLDLLAVQGTLKNLLQRHSSEAPILWLSAFLRVQLSHPYKPLEKPIYSKIQSVVTGIWDPSHNQKSRTFIHWFVKQILNYQGDPVILTPYEELGIFQGEKHTVSAPWGLHPSGKERRKAINWTQHL